MLVVSRFSALLDACILVPAPLADTLLRLAECGLYRPLWTARILDEMVWAIERIHPRHANGPARTRAEVMASAFDDAMVRGWEPLVPGIKLPDPDDRHVVAAAIRGRADVIVTANLSDFPPDVLEPLGLDVQSPDEFLCHQLDLAPDRAVAVIRQQAEDTAKPSISFDGLLPRIAACGAPAFSDAVHRQRWRLD